VTEDQEDKVTITEDHQYNIMLTEDQDKIMITEYQDDKTLEVIEDHPFNSLKSKPLSQQIKT
jgi:hypothetical protein